MTEFACIKTEISAVAFHHTLLNEIHANRAGRQKVADHTFTAGELNQISLAVGDHDETLRPGKLNWDRAAQPALIEATLAEMARQFPYIEEDQL